MRPPLNCRASGFVQSLESQPLSGLVLAIARGTVEYHWVEGRYDTLPMLTADLVRHRVAVIVTPGFPLAARAAKDATSSASAKTPSSWA